MFKVYQRVTFKQFIVCAPVVKLLIEKEENLSCGYKFGHILRLTFSSLKIFYALFVGDSIPLPAFALHRLYYMKNDFCLKISS